MHGPHLILHACKVIYIYIYIYIYEILLQDLVFIACMQPMQYYLLILVIGHAWAASETYNTPIYAILLCNLCMLTNIVKL
jgi:hypothetical protein